MIGIIKKHKSIFLTITISFIILISCYFGISSATISSESDLLSGSASSLVGEYASETLRATLMNKGQSDCFYHNASSTVLHYIHAVYDVDFDTTNGVMRVYSQVGSSTMTKNTTDSSAATHIGRLASASTMSGNARKVKEVLQAGFGTAWLKESAIDSTQYAWDDASEVNYNTTLNTSYYANYKKMSQSDTNTKTESDKTVTINSKEYIIVGTFKINFAGQGIASVTASSASWTSTSSTDIYWCTSASTTASDWSNDFNKTSSGAYYLNNRNFYLAIRTDKLPETGTYTVTITQNEFKYYHSRVIVTTSNDSSNSTQKGQQTGWYAYANSPTTVTGTAQWTVKVNRNVNLTITKKDAKTGSVVSGGKFKLYAELNDGTTGWVSGTVDGTKSYVSSASSATEYDSQTEIKSLKKGVYYIYETQAVDGDYGLDNQSGYGVTTSPGGSSISGEFVYLGSKDCSSSSGSVTFTANQQAYGAIQITKYDSTTNTSLTGAGFEIYAVLSNGTSGWVTGDATGTKTYVTDRSTGTVYTMTSTTLDITELLYGKYYIYETSAPSDEYLLADQDGYHDTNNGEAEGYDSFESDEDWVYIGCGTINKNTPISDPLLVNVPNAKAPTVSLNKVDEIVTDYELEGAEFKIYAELTDGTTAWLTGDADGEKTYSVTTASEATIYSANDEISKLRYGTYYVYEITAPTTDTNYVLADQEGYLQTTDSSGNDLPGVSTFETSDEWAYRGSITLSSNDAGTTVGIELTNRPEGSMQIGETGDTDGDTGKVDSITGEALSGAEFKIYAELETTGIDGISSGWVSGGANDGTLKQYVSYSSASTYTSGEVISRLRYGTYYIYETKAPSDEYDLRDQEKYHATSDEDGEAKGYEYFADDEEWVYVGQVTINFDVVKQEATTGYTLNVPFETETVENNQKGKLQIEKVDEEYEVLKLKGAEFVVYAELDSEDIENGWVKGNASDVKEYSSNYSEATVYTTDEDGLTEVIEKLNYGTYYIYEIKTPEGYDITKQDNYLTAPNGAVTPDTDNWVYVETVEINVEELTILYNNSIANGGEEYEIPPYEVTKGNLKAVNELEGLVWLDVPDTKGNTGNNLYKENNADQNDEELGGIEVRLYLQDANGSYYKAATTYTQNDGTYTFSFDPDADNYCGIEVTYWQLVTAYVEFVYDNTEYVVVDPFVTATDGMNITINSKAQEVEMEAEELEDENLTGTTGEYPGLAVTYQGGTLGNATVDELNEILSNNETVVNGQSTTEILNTTPLTGYYEKDSSDENHYKVSNINLGVLEKIDPTYEITETLSYAYLTINGYTYTYYYDTPEDGTIEYASTDDLPADVLKQLNSKDYTKAESVSVYASDIESTFKAGRTSNMKLYLVYGIYVYNSETYTTDDLYYEEKLYLTSLTDQYDTKRMELSTDNSNNSNCIGSDQFGLWSGSGGEVSYDLDNENSNYSSGIGAGETIKTYVQFQVTENALELLIDEPGTINQWNYENVSTAYASGFHEYRRTDNLWNQTETASSRWYNDHREDSYTEKNGNDLYYIHKSVTVDEDSGAYYVALILNDEEEDERTITGVVYEDESETDDEGNETGVGNGIIDSDEKNIASGVTVTLLSASSLTTDDEGNETYTINTDENGNIELEVAELYPVEVTYDENGVVGTVAIVYATDEEGNVIYDEEGNPTYQTATTTTNEYGEYTFKGVTPGYYYIQYTYGDGSQEIGYIDDESGEFVKVDELTSNDYRSTIINTNEAEDYIKDALELGDGEILSYATILEKYYNDDIELENGETISYAEAIERYNNGELDSFTEEEIKELQKAAELLEWYKYLSESIDFNTAVDDVSEDSARNIMNSYTYTSQGVYDADENLIATYDTEEYEESGDMNDITLTATNGNDFPLSVTAETPIISVSIENDNETSTEVYDETGLVRTDVHTATFNGFNFGLIKQETDVEVEKVISKASITLQQGSTIFSGNPATESSTYATALETAAVKNGILGSKYIRVELEEDLIYGSSIEVEYTVTITNEAAEAYDSVYWYKYGEQDPTGDTQSTITVNEVVDLLDEKYTVKELLNNADGTSGEITQILLDSDGNEVTVETEEKVEISTESQYESVSEYYEEYTETDLYFSGFYAMSSGQSVQISYSVSGLANSNDDTEYKNTVELTSLSLSGLKTLNSDFEWPWSGGGHTADGTDIVLTPETGANRSNTYWVAGAIALLVVAGGVVILKKKVLK